MRIYKLICSLIILFFLQALTSKSEPINPFEDGSILGDRFSFNPKSTIDIIPPSLGSRFLGNDIVTIKWWHKSKISTKAETWIQIKLLKLSSSEERWTIYSSTVGSIRSIDDTRKIVWKIPDLSPGLYCLIVTEGLYQKELSEMIGRIINLTNTTIRFIEIVDGPNNLPLNPPMLTYFKPPSA